MALFDKHYVKTLYYFPHYGTIDIIDIKIVIADFESYH